MCIDYFSMTHQDAFGSKALKLVSDAFMDEEEWEHHDSGINLANGMKQIQK